jgi:hypothetical protein
MCVRMHEQDVQTKKLAAAKLEQDAVTENNDKSILKLQDQIRARSVGLNRLRTSTVELNKAARDEVAELKYAALDPPESVRKPARAVEVITSPIHYTY